MKNQKFYINDTFVSKDLESLDLSIIPPQARRRLASVDRMTLCALVKLFSKNTKKIVFSSMYGEMEKLIKIIDEIEEYNEVSPSQFSGSVHNFPVSNFNIFKKSNVPYSAINSAQNSISAALIEAITSPEDEVVVCYTDSCNINKCIALTISKEKTDNSTECVLTDKKEKYFEDEFEEMVLFLSGKKDEFNSKLCSIKRIKE